MAWLVPVAACLRRFRGPAAGPSAARRSGGRDPARHRGRHRGRGRAAALGAAAPGPYLGPLLGLHPDRRRPAAASRGGTPTTRPAPAGSRLHVGTSVNGLSALLAVDGLRGRRLLVQVYSTAYLRGDRRLRALLRRGLAVRRGDAAGRPRQRPARAPRRLGGHGPVLLPAGRPLPRVARRRRWPPSRRSSSPGSVTSASCSASSCSAAARTPSTSTASSTPSRPRAPDTGRAGTLLLLGRRRRQERAVPAARPGCPTRWPARRRCRALIHAATMVAAGIFVVALLYPVFAAVAGDDDVLALAAVADHARRRARRAGARTTSSGCSPGRRSASSPTWRRRCPSAAGSRRCSITARHASFKALLFLAAGSVLRCGRHQPDERDGRPRARDAVDVRRDRRRRARAGRDPAVRRCLRQGRVLDAARSVAARDQRRPASAPGSGSSLRRRAGHGRPHRRLHHPHGGPHLPRPAPRRRRRSTSRR